MFFLVVVEPESSLFGLENSSCCCCCKCSWYLFYVFNVFFKLLIFLHIRIVTSTFQLPEVFFLPQLFDCLLKQLLFYILLTFFQYLLIKNNLFFLKLLCRFYWYTTSNHHAKTSISKFKYLSFFRYFQTLFACCYRILN